MDSKRYKGALYIIKIKQLSDEAVYINGHWYSENKSFADVLNNSAQPKHIKGYYTNIQEELIIIVKELYKNIEVVEMTGDTPEVIFEEPVY